MYKTHVPTIVWRKTSSLSPYDGPLRTGVSNRLPADALTYLRKITMVNSLIIIAQLCST